MVRQSVWRLIAIGDILVFAFGCSENTAPVIDELIIPETVETGSIVNFQVFASDIDRNVLTYIWRVDNKTLSSTTPIVTWIAPNVDGTVLVEVRVSDGGNKPIIRRRHLSVVSTEFLIKQVLEQRWRIGYMTEDLELYLSAFWERGFLYRSDNGTPNDSNDDVIFNSIRQEENSVMDIFKRFDNIEIEVSATDITFVSENKAIARHHYRIQAVVAKGEDLLEGGFTGWIAEGDNEFTFERRQTVDGQMEWRITKWIDLAFDMAKIRANNPELAPFFKMTLGHLVNRNLPTRWGKVKLLM